MGAPHWNNSSRHGICWHLCSRHRRSDEFLRDCGTGVLCDWWSSLVCTRGQEECQEQFHCLGHLLVHWVCRPRNSVRVVQRRRQSPSVEYFCPVIISRERRHPFRFIMHAKYKLVRV